MEHLIPIKVMTSSIRQNELSNTEWESFYLIISRGEYSMVAGGKYSFLDSSYILTSKKYTYIEGKSFDYNEYLKSKKDYNNPWYKDSAEFSVKKYFLKEDYSCNAIYSKGKLGKIIVFLNDSILVLCDLKNIVERTDGFYAYEYEKYISLKYINDKNIVENNYLIKQEHNFHFYVPLQDLIDIDTLKFNIRGWTNENIKISKHYKGKILKYNNDIQLIFNREGKVVDIFFENKYDPQIEEDIINSFKSMPTIGILAPKREYPVSCWQNDYTFKTKQKIKIQLEK